MVLVDSAGHTYAQSGLEGTPLTTELIPGESYTTTLTFIVTRTDSSLRLLITSTDRPMKLLIGNEMSWGHKKTFLGV